MFNRILVPLDGSKLAERAIPHAEQFARIFGSTIVLLQVLEPISYHENPNPVDPLYWQIRKTEVDMYLQTIAARIRKNLNGEIPVSGSEENSAAANNQICVEYSIREGKPADNIINFAQTEGIDLLIICTHGSGGLSCWNIGSVTQKVINLIYLPILVVRADTAHPIEQGKVTYQHILLPIDSSRRAECSLSAAIMLAQGEKSLNITPEGESQSTPAAVSPQTKLILAAVIKPPEIPIPEPYPVEIEKLSKRMMAISHQVVANYLNEMKERLPVESETRIVENKSVALAIQELANDEQNIDLVILCAHGYTGQSTWPYGTIARNYLENGTNSVLVIQDVPQPQVRQSTTAVLFTKFKGH
jgi:nucleotide-binding universal stress UspA family protein